MARKQTSAPIQSKAKRQKREELPSEASNSDQHDSEEELEIANDDESGQDEGEEEEEDHSEDVDEQEEDDVAEDEEVDGEAMSDIEDDEDDEDEKERLKRDAIAYRAALEKRGVIYMSRIPPFMKPNKVRTLLEEYGKITRLFLAEEDSQVRNKRKERGGNASKQFREGWIEFADKKIARRVADSLNNTSIGGKKSDYYHDDIWNLKYLKNFKWEYLTEKLAYERRVREMKLKAALAQSKKTNAEMKQLIEQTKVQDIIRQRKKSRGDGDADDAPREGVDSNRMKRRFRQHKVLGVDYDEKDNRVGKSLLGSIFTSKSK